MASIFCGLPPPFLGFAHLFAEKQCFSECRSLIRDYAAAYAGGASVREPAAKPQERGAAIGEAELHRK